MNTPFEIRLRVEELNYDTQAVLLGVNEYPINVTLQHTIGEIKDSIWTNSTDYKLNPNLLQIYHNGRELLNSETISSILNISEAPSSPLTQVFLLKIDYSNFVNHPTSVPPHILFDIILKWRDSHEKENKHNMRETLKCTIGIIKDYIIEQEQRKGLHQGLSRNDIQLRNLPDRKFMTDDNLTLGEMLKLDVPPLEPVVFVFDVRTSTRSTLQIVIESNEPTLQNERKIFEIDQNFRVQELKQLIIARIDLGGVSRTHFGQIELTYNGQELPNTKEINQSTVIDVLHLNQSTSNENNEIVVHLNISSNISKANVLSSSFWRDLGQTGSFEFLPGALQRVVEGSSSKQEQSLSHEQFSHKVDPIEPTKLITKDQTVWKLDGESFEVISSNAGQRLTEQSSISNQEYEVTLKVDNVIKTATLNTSQCIIVDNDLHQPYLLVNSSGVAKLDSAFVSSSGESLLEKVEIMVHSPIKQTMISSAGNTTTPRRIENEIQPEEHRDDNPVQQVGAAGNAVEERILDRTLNEGKRLLLLAFKIVVVLYIMGVRPNEHVKTYWKFYMFVILLVFQLYILVFTVRNAYLAQQANQNRPGIARVGNVFLGLQNRVTYLCRAISSFQDGIIKMGVHRTWDYELILTGRNQFIKQLSYNLESLWKDSLLGFLLLFPSFQVKVYEELENWRDNELRELQDKTILFYESKIKQLIQFYNVKLTQNFEIPHSMSFSNVESILADIDNIEDPEISKAEKNERKFKLLIDYYQCLEVVSDVLNRAIVTSQVAPESFILDLENTWSLLTDSILKVQNENENENENPDNSPEEIVAENLRLQDTSNQDEIPQESIPHQEESPRQQDIDEEIIEGHNHTTASGSRILHEQPEI